MNRSFLKLSSLVLFIGVIVMSCSKSDPKPLGAQTNATLLAGDKGKTKSWKLIGLTYAVGTGATTPQTLPACFADNLYTFSNNDAQEYTANEGTSKCNTGDPDKIEAGTWAFTLDGLTLNIEVDKTYSANGLYSPEPLIYTDANNNPVALTIGYPYPAFVNTLTATSMVLQMNNVVGSSTYVFTLTFTAN